MGTAMSRNLVKAGWDVTVWNRTPAQCSEIMGARAGATPADVVRACDITFAMLSDPEACLEVALGAMGVPPCAGHHWKHSHALPPPGRRPTRGRIGSARAPSLLCFSPPANPTACQPPTSSLPPPPLPPTPSLPHPPGPDGVAAGMAPGKGFVDVSTVDAATAAAVRDAVVAAGGAYLEAPVSGSKGPAEAGQLIFLCGGAPRRQEGAGGEHATLQLRATTCWLRAAEGG